MPAIVLNLAAQPVIDYDRMLDAISAVESGGNWFARGRDGEAGEFQFTQSTWSSETSEAFSEAFNRGVARGVARRHLFTIIFALREARLEETPWMIACCWRCGVDGAILRSFQSQAVRDYCERVSALYLAKP